MKRMLEGRRKKYVTRACDACKRRKSKCDGGEPCSRCMASGIDCAYKSSYKRVKKRKLMEYTTNEKDTSPLGTVEPTLAPRSDLPQLSVEPETDQNGVSMDTMVAEENSDDASVHAFLRNVYRHLSTMGQAMPRNLTRPVEHTLDSDPGGSTFVLPPENFGKQYLDCVFEHSNVTYRYLPLKQTYELLEKLYRQDPEVLQNKSIMAVLLLALSLGCVWFASWKGKDVAEYRMKASRLYQAGKALLEESSTVFPPTIQIMQASVLQCQIELAMNMFNRAWMSVGSAVRLGQIIGFHRVSKYYKPRDEYARRGVFWTLFMIDRYLSVVLGRPTVIGETDITIPYPEIPNEYLDAELGSQEGKIAAGVVAHVKLVKIVGRIMTRLYPATNAGSEQRYIVMAKVENELQQWLHETPSFFHPKLETVHMAEDTYYNIPWIFRRQQCTIRAAYNFTVMLAYRGYLLDEFLHTNFKFSSTSPPSYNVLKCVQAARLMAHFAGEIASDEKYNGVYWTTSYFIFCAISILVVYLTLYPNGEDQSMTTAIIEKAMIGYKRLDNSRGLTSQKLLEESKVIAENVRVESVRGTGPANRTAKAAHISNSDSADTTAPASGGQICNLSVDPSEPSTLAFNISASDSLSDLDTLGPLPDGDTLDLIMGFGFDNSTFALDNHNIDL